MGQPTKEQWLHWLVTDVNKFHKIREEVGWCEIDLIGTTFTRAGLTRVNLTRANLTRANLTKANFAGTDLTEANFTEANFTEANFTEANLTRANLAKANLTRANLTKANLTRANLRGASLVGVNLTRTKLSLADIRGSHIDYASWPIWCGGMDVIMDKEQVKILLYIQFKNLEKNNIKIPKSTVEFVAWVNNSKIRTYHRLGQAHLNISNK